MPCIHRSSHDPPAFHCGLLQYKSELFETDPAYRTPEPRYRLKDLKAFLERQQFIDNSMALYNVEQRAKWLPKNDPPLSRDVFGVKLIYREPFMKSRGPGDYSDAKVEAYYAEECNECPHHGLKLTQARLRYLKEERLDLNTAWIPEIQERREQLKPCGEKYRPGTNFEEDNVQQKGYGTDYILDLMGQIYDAYAAAVDLRRGEIDAEILLLEAKKRELIRKVNILASDWLKVNFLVAMETGTDLKQTRRDSFDMDCSNSSTRGSED